MFGCCVVRLVGDFCCFVVKFCCGYVGWSMGCLVFCFFDCLCVWLFGSLLELFCVCLVACFCVWVFGGLRVCLRVIVSLVVRLLVWSCWLFGYLLCCVV